MDKATKDIKIQLRHIIESRHGEKQAWTADRIAEVLGIRGRNADRKVRAMILDLIWSENLAVLATVGKNPGYFTPETWAEWDRYKKQIDDRIKGVIMRRDKLDRNIHALFEGTMKVRML